MERALAGNLPGDGTISFDNGKIPHAPQQTVDNPWCSAAPLCDLIRTVSRYRDFQDGCTPRYNLHQFFGRIQVEPGDDTEPVPERGT